MELHKLKKRKQNKYLEIEADEASDEESELDEEIKELIDRDGQKQADFLYSKRDKRRDIVQEMEKKYKQQENDEASVDGLASVEEDEIYPPKIDDPKVCFLFNPILDLESYLHKGKRKRFSDQFNVQIQQLPQN